MFLETSLCNTPCVSNTFVGEMVFLSRGRAKPRVNKKFLRENVFLDGGFCKNSAVFNNWAGGHFSLQISSRKLLSPGKFKKLS